MRLKQPVRGIHIGGCVTGEPLPADILAHAHISSTSPRWAHGYICAHTKRDLLTALLEELAHLGADAGHNDSWRRKMRGLGARIPAAHRKRLRKGADRSA
jgi:hypothetical protein